MTTLSSLNSKVALVTGASRGINRGIAVELAARGASVIVAYSASAGPGRKSLKKLKEAVVRPSLYKPIAPTSSRSQASLKKALEHFGKIDIVISNAGVESFGDIGEVTPEEFDRVFGLNTRGQFFVVQQAYKHIPHGDRLILMSSISANLRGVPGHSVYSPSKAAVEAFGHCLREDFESKKVTVNVVAPGGVKSDMSAANGHHYIPAADPSWNMEQIEKVIAGATLLKRMADPVNVARVVTFLFSDEGEWINGES